MNADFYRAFEERYRGSRDLIKNRLQVYLPFVEKLQTLHQDTLVVDLGCGRGEWLELLGEQGILAQGIDLDDQMLAACRERNLMVETADALSWLANRPDESCDLVSALHLAEHLPFELIDHLVEHALRVLRPGGLLILETPNPENIVVGTTNFYLDPTHQRPLPPSLLAFLPEYYGFGRTKIMRLQESAELAAGREPTLFDVLGGASPDYAVIAQKQGDSSKLAIFDALFEQDYGLKTDTLAWRYEVAHQQSLRGALELAGQGVDRCNALSVEQQQQNQAIQQHQQQIQALQQQQQLIQALQQEIQALQQQLQDLFASRSWRLTAPLRDLSTGLRSLSFATPAAHVKGACCHLLLFALRQTEKHPALAKSIRAAVSHFPRLKAHLRRIVAHRTTESAAVPTPENGRCANQVNALTPAARRVYADLLAAVEEFKSKEKT